MTTYLRHGRGQIGVQEHNNVGVRGLHAPPYCMALATIDIVPHHPHTRVAGGHLLCKLARFVRAAVIHHDNLAVHAGVIEVAQDLGQGALYPLALVVSRHNDGERFRGPLNVVHANYLRYQPTCVVAVSR